MKTYNVTAKLYGEYSILMFDDKSVMIRWALHDDGSQMESPMYHKKAFPEGKFILRSFIYGAKGLQSFIDEYFNPEVVKLNIL